MIDVFKVGVHLGMTSNAPMMLGVIAAHFAKLHVSSKQLESQLGKVALAAGGSVAAMAGIGIVKGVWHAIDASKELNKELNRTAQLGGSLAIDPKVLRDRAFAAAREVRTMSPSDAVKMEREMAGQLGSHEKAFSLLPSAGRLAWNLQEFTGVSSESAIRDTIKTADLWGHIFSHTGKNGEEEVDEKLMAKAMDYMARGVKSSGGMLKPADYLAFMKQSGLGGKSMDPESLFGWATEAMVAMGASRAGTATSSLFQQFQGGTAPAHAWREFAAKSGGVFKEGRDFVVQKGGHTNITEHGRGALHLDHQGNAPLQWVNDTLIPMLLKGGVKEKDILTELTKILGRQTTQRLVGEAYQNKVQFARTAGIFKHSMGADEASKMLHEKDLETNLEELKKGWQGFMEALGEPGIPMAIAVLHKLTDGIHMMTDYVSAHPEAAAQLLQYTAAFGGLLALGGTMMVVTVLLSPFTTALRGLFVVLTSLPAATAALGAFSTGLGSLVGVILRVLGPLGAVLAVMSPSSTNAGEQEALERYKAMSPEERSKALDPKGWKPNESKPGLLDSLLDGMGIPRMAQPLAPGQRGALPTGATVPGAPVTPGGAPITTTPPAAGSVVDQKITLEVDGRAMAETVNRINLGAATRPNAGGTGFNSRTSMPSPVGAR